MKFSEYIGLNNPEGVNRVLAANGYEQCDYLEDCPHAVEFLMLNVGQKATEELLLEHPDYDMIVALDKEKNKTPEIFEPNPVMSVMPESPKVSAEVPRSFLSDSLKEILVIILVFWVVNKIIST